MRFLFTQSDLVGSKAIRWGLGHDVSHVAVEVSPSCFAAPVILESRLEDGARFKVREVFLERNRIVRCLSLVDNDQALEDAYYRSLCEHSSGRSYDRKAFGFWICAVVAKRLIGIDVPLKNPWGTANDHLCVEAIVRGSETLLSKALGIDLSGIDFEMTSPFGLYETLAASPRLTKG